MDIASLNLPFYTTKLQPKCQIRVVLMRLRPRYKRITTQHQRVELRLLDLNSDLEDTVTICVFRVSPPLDSNYVTIELPPAIQIYAINR